MTDPVIFMTKSVKTMTTQVICTTVLFMTNQTIFVKKKKKKKKKKIKVQMKLYLGQISFLGQTVVFGANKILFRATTVLFELHAVLYSDIPKS